MFTDMVGYTALAQRNETLAMELLEEQRSLLRQFFVKHLGREVKTMGDAFLVEFASALEAVKCAGEIQAALREENLKRPKERRILARVGIHLGDVIHTGSDVAGDAVNIASRVETLAPPGGICVSGQVYSSVANKVDYRFETLGNPELKNVAIPVEVYQVLGFGQSVSSIQLTKVGPSKDRIAVLPFVNMSPNPDDEYLDDGITEEVIATVSKIESLQVVSRTSVMQYKKTSKQVPEVSKELKVGTILEGSVRRSEDRLRITVQMVDAANDRHMWAESYDRSLRDIFAIQRDVAKRVAETLRIRLQSRVEQRISRTYTQNVEAHIQYLQGLSQLRRAVDPKGLRDAISLLEFAIEKDPDFALAHAALSEAYTYAAGEILPVEAGFEKAREFALKATGLDKDLADGHASLGIMAIQNFGDWPTTERELNRALELNPSHVTARLWYGIYLANQRKKFDEGLAEIKRAEELDPLSAFVKMHAGISLTFARKYSESIEKLRESLALNEKDPVALCHLGLSYLLVGNNRDAVATAKVAEAFTGGLGGPLGLVGYVYGSAGEREEALSLLDRLKTGYKGATTDSQFNIGLVCLGLGRNKEALDHIEKAYRQRDPLVILLNPGVNPVFDPVRAHPRLRSILKELYGR
jgi:TolB-like protein